MNRAIFFDLDGTLWDALEEINDSYNAFMLENNLPYRFTKDITSSYMGLTPLETARLAFKDLDDDKAMKLFHLLFKFEIAYLRKHPGKLYNNEEEVINALSKSYPLYIVSNADKGYIENYLFGCNMNQYFKGHICAGDTDCDKATNIKILMEKEGINEVIYVGDTLKDYEQSKKAGVQFIYASYGFGSIDFKVNKIDNLNELIPLISKIFNN